MTVEPTPPPALHELEAEVMNVMWDRGEASVREVMEELNAAAAKPRAYTTYMTILGRLHTKRLLDRRREGKTDIYHPVHTREEYADLRAQAEVAAVVDAFGDVALGHFARQMGDLDPDRRRALERLARGRGARRPPAAPLRPAGPRRQLRPGGLCAGGGHRDQRRPRLPGRRAPPR